MTRKDTVTEAPKILRRPKAHSLYQRATAPSFCKAPWSNVNFFFALIDTATTSSYHYHMLQRFFTATGERTLRALGALGGILNFTLRSVASPLIGGFPPRKVMFIQMYNIGNASVPVILLTGLFTGLVLAAQAYFQFKRIGMQTMVGAIVAPSMAKELGPVLTGLMLAGRVGAAIAAELGTMRVTEQIDAMETLATDPYSFLIFPRLTACVLLTPMLVGLSDLVGITGGYLLSVHAFGITETYYLLHSKQYLDAWGVVSGAIKGGVFGGLLCMISCYKGFYTTGGAEGVGRSTTEAVVLSSICILIANFFLTLVMY